VTDQSICRTRGNQLKSFNADGSLRWKKNLKTSIQSSPAVGPDGTVFICTQHRKPNAIDPVDGSLKRSGDMEFFGSPRPAVASDGSVSLTDDQDKIYRFDKDGALLWKKASPGKLNGPVSVGRDGTTFAPSEDGKLYAYDRDGNEKWAYEAGSPLRRAPVERKV